MSPPKPPESPARNWGIALLLALAVLAGGIYFWTQSRNRPEPPTPAPVVAAPLKSTEAEPPAQPQVKHPVQAIPVPPSAPAEPLPPRAQSDSAAKSAAQTLATPGEIAGLLFPDSFVRRFVATVDNLPRPTLSMRVRMIRGTPGLFMTSGAEGGRSIAPENSSRYTAFVRFVRGLDAKKLVSVYLRFYPLLQEEYRSLGFPNKQFNDRVVEAIDDMLSAPEPKGPILLVQPKVMYKFADPALESLSAGRKIMVRVGNDNAQILKAKLREIRALLASAKTN
ncbi:MAG: DUF3014 domain-containing protein [Quisquiliibacterium sp.]